MANSDPYIRHQIRIENLKEGEARKTVSMLNQTHQELLKRLESTNGVWTRERLVSVTAQYSTAIDMVYADSIIPDMQKTGLKFTEKNMAFHYTALEETAGETAAVVSTLDPLAVYVAAVTEPMQGKVMSQWANELQITDKIRVSAELKTSWLAGENVNKAANRLRPILKLSRNNLASVTRTYYGHLAADTRNAVWRENSDIIEGVVWESILDNRTTQDICGPRDQTKYTLDGEPIKHGLQWLGGPGQAHWNCRSTSFPTIKGVKYTTNRTALSAGRNYQRGDNTTRTGRVRTNSKVARQKGIYKESQHRAATNYEGWLQNQPAAFQDDVLGIQKAKAFRSGAWTYGQKFKPQNPITIDQF